MMITTATALEDIYAILMTNAPSRITSPFFFPSPQQSHFRLDQIALVDSKHGLDEAAMVNIGDGQ